MGPEQMRGSERRAGRFLFLALLLIAAGAAAQELRGLGEETVWALRGRRPLAGGAAPHWPEDCSRSFGFRWFWRRAWSRI